MVVCAMVVVCVALLRGHDPDGRMMTQIMQLATGIGCGIIGNAMRDNKPQ